MTILVSKLYRISVHVTLISHAYIKYILVSQKAGKATFLILHICFQNTELVIRGSSVKIVWQKIQSQSQSLLKKASDTGAFQVFNNTYFEELLQMALDNSKYYNNTLFHKNKPPASTGIRKDKS